MIPWRSRNISDTNSWRAWDGSGFTVAATDPYTTTAAGPPSPPPAAGRRRAAVPTTPVRGQVVWSEVAGGCWLLVGAYGPGPLSQWAYSTSADLVTWSATVDLVAFNWEPQLAFPGYFYVSIIDIDWEGNVGNNFISSGPNPYLY